MAANTLDIWLIVFDYLDLILSLVLRITFDILILLTSPIWYFYERYIASGLSLNSLMNAKTFNSILITGASSGIGQGVAIEFTQRNKSDDLALYLLGRNMERLNETKKKCLKYNANIKIFCYSVDIRNKDKLQSILLKCDNYKPIDLIFANVGINTGQCPSNDWFEQFDEMMNINIIGTFNTVFPLLKRFISRQHGHIAFNASLLGYNTLFGSTSIYAATKVFIRFMSEIIRNSLKFYNIDTTVINLGFIDTRMTSKGVAKWTKSVKQTAKVIVDGIIRNKATINYPFHFSVLMWYFGSLHPIIYSCIAWMTMSDKKESDYVFFDYLPQECRQRC